MFTKKPKLLYNNFTTGRNIDQVKYNYILTHLRSEESYNDIPYHIRMKSVNNFKIAYKRYRNDLKVKPKVVKNKNNRGYTLVWPGI